MKLLAFSFLISYLINFLILRYKHISKKINDDGTSFHPQKFHKNTVPRIGGLSIYIALLASVALTYSFNLSESTLLVNLILCGTPTFFAGITEDFFKKDLIKTRLFATSISAVLGGYILSYWLKQINVPGIDWLLHIKFISIIVTTIAIVGVVNSYNIIDGFNGLASMVACICFIAIAFVSFLENDLEIASASLVLIGGIIGFFVWNYPKGLIFLGDGGAYILGFFIATLSLLLVMRNPNVSPWFGLLINIYPIFETLFTIWRRITYQNSSPTKADKAHLHSLIFRKIINNKKNKTTPYYLLNSRTSPLLWFLCIFTVIPAIIFRQNTFALQVLVILFCLTYIKLYGAIIDLKNNHR